MSLSQLPAEMVARISNFADFETVCALRRASKGFNYAVDINFRRFFENAEVHFDRQSYDRFMSIEGYAFAQDSVKSLTLCPGDLTYSYDALDIVGGNPDLTACFTKLFKCLRNCEVVKVKWTNFKGGFEAAQSFLGCLYSTIHELSPSLRVFKPFNLDDDDTYPRACLYTYQFSPLDGALHPMQSLAETDFWPGVGSDFDTSQANTLRNIFVKMPNLKKLHMHVTSVSQFQATERIDNFWTNLRLDVPQLTHLKVDCALQRVGSLTAFISQHPSISHLDLDLSFTHDADFSTAARELISCLASSLPNLAGLKLVIEVFAAGDGPLQPRQLRIEGSGSPLGEGRDDFFRSLADTLQHPEAWPVSEET